MKLNDLKPAPGSKKVRRRVGRGIGSGRGKTSGRGQKGQAARSGFSQRAGWEGGRSSLIARLPKRGFNRAGLQIDYQIVNIESLNVLPADTNVNSITLYEHGLSRHIDRPAKPLGRGELEGRGPSVDVDRISRSAAAAVTALGGKVVRPVPEEEQDGQDVAAADAAAEEPATADSAGEDSADAEQA